MKENKQLRKENEQLKYRVQELEARTKKNSSNSNGALNILKKSKAVDLSVLCSSGEVDTPQRIRIA
ncbi:hypothetical protein B9L21_09385 [Geobacillus uzenensis]|uniref:Transposase n=1 Tax=Geobacillus uzenensis TaxID=129339 RepID=A0ABX4DGR1_9BACL|nr:hypothetical protein B9L21_09385 [Geobacillus uzenensis]